MKSDFLLALTQLAAEKNLSREVVVSAVEAALVSAFKKDSQGGHHVVSVKIHPTTGQVKVYAEKTVVEEPTDARQELSLAEAQRMKQEAQLDEVIEVEIPPPSNAGRIAAQTARQVVLQRLREAEREVVFSEYADKEGDIVSGVVQRLEPRQITIELGRAEAVLLPSEQVKTERYRKGQRLKFYLMEVQRLAKGPQLLVSRTHRNLVRRLFELEVPEIYNGTVELKAIAREPGYRSKVAVVARQEGIDPVGSCVGLRGIRIQNIINEIDGEKIDVIEWHPDPAVFIAHALSPAQVLNVRLDEEGNATVVVPDRQLSLAIGKEGQNARLAAKLTGCKIDIKSASAAEEEKAALRKEEEALQAQKAAAAGSAVAVAEEPSLPISPEAAPAELAKEKATVPVETALAEEPAPAPLPFEDTRIRFAEEILAEPKKPDRKAKKTKKKKIAPEKEEKELQVATPLKKERKEWKPSLEEDLEEGDVDI